MSFLQTLMPSGLGDVSFINTFLSSLGTTLGVGLVTIPALLQNGNTSLGLLPVPVLPDFLGGPGQTGAPWGDRMANDTNYYQDIPTTGVTRKYDFTVARATIAPDGYEKSAMLVNGQFPGPTIEADWGDWIEVTVHNAITNPEDGTAIHWHGCVSSLMLDFSTQS
jgi:FtsP/CotA-like multicopper oxidase with cupredoxin domain